MIPLLLFYLRMATAENVLHVSEKEFNSVMGENKMVVAACS